MVPRTRRRLLQGAAALLAGLAGCNDASDPSNPPSPTHPANPGLSNVEHDPAVRQVRRSDDRPAAWLPDEEASTDGTAPPPDDPPQIELVTSAERADSLVVAGDGADAARSFVESTDFASESVYVLSDSVNECYRLVPCYVTWNRTEVEAEFGRVLRPHDVRCSADARDSVATFVRIPAALDPRQVSSLGASTHGGGCRPPPGERGRDGLAEEVSR